MSEPLSQPLPIFLTDLKQTLLEDDAYIAAKYNMPHHELEDPEHKLADHKLERYKVRTLFVIEPLSKEKIRDAVQAQQAAFYKRKKIRIACDDSVWQLFGYTEALLRDIENKLDNLSRDAVYLKLKLKRETKKHQEAQQLLVDFYNLPWWKRAWLSLNKQISKS